MPIAQLGADGTSTLAVDPTHKAVHLTMRPTEVSGSYTINFSSVTATSPAANIGMVSFRWGSTTKLCLLRRLRIELLVTTAGTANWAEMQAFVNRAFTSSATGGSTISLAGNNGKRRTSYPTSEIASNGDIRYGSGAALTTAGTRTQDPIAITRVYAALAVGTKPIGIDWGGQLSTNPIVLAQNEGIEIQNAQTFTTGVIRFRIQMDWDEVPIGAW